jgi:hypothetical protein
MEGQVLQNEVILPPVEAIPGTEVSNMSGGMPPPSLSMTVSGEGLTRGPGVPGGAPVISVRTDREAYMADGIIDPGFGGFGNRQVRRSGYRGGGMGMGMGPMMPMAPRYTPMEGGSEGGSSSSGPIRITKLE